jgi:hypothetical protein
MKLRGALRLLILTWLIAIPTIAAATAGDFDKNGDTDIVWRNSATGQVYIWLMNATTISGSGSPGGATLDWSIQGVGDFDGDGDADILWRNSTTGQVYIWLMDGSTIAGSGSPGSATLDWSIQGVGDFDGDGDADILWRNTTTGQVYIWRMNGSTIAASGSGSPGSATLDWSIQGVGDFNKDGDADILWRNSTTGQVYIWLMQGSTIAAGGSGSPGGATLDWSIQGVGDFNKDGDADILWRNSTSGQVYIWLMNAFTIDGSGSPGSATLDWSIQGVGDYNNDGDADILWRNSNSGEAYIWLMNGTSLNGGGSPGGAPAGWQTSPGPAGNTALASAIAVSGNRFVNAAGNAVELVGTNISGLELQSSLWPGIAGLTAAQWKALASTWSQLGQTINVIRLPLNSYSWLNLTCVDPGSGDAGNNYHANGGGTFTPDPTSAYQADVEQTVTAITAAGLYVVLDLQWDAPNNASGQPMCPVGQPAFASADHAPAFWTSVANAFQGNAAVIFELFNEPFGDNVYGNGVIQNGSVYTPGPDATMMASGGSWTHPFMMQDNANQNQNCGPNHNQSCQNELFNTNAPNPVQIAGELSLLSAIRATGAANVVLASPIGYAGEIEIWLGSYASAGNPDPLGQFGAAWHIYGYAKGTAPPLAVLAAGYPIAITETYGFDAAIDGGKNLNGYNWAAQNGIGYLWWGLNNWGDQATPALYTKLAADVPWLDSTTP